MKIDAIRVNGFRGITPVREDPPAVDMELCDSNFSAKNLLLFGPNAFGKSSIADAIEWFFNGRSRGALYFEEFSQSDNAHLKLGAPGFADEGYVELEVTHNGNQTTIRRCFDSRGVQVSESLGGLDNLLDQIRDELIVLDHDQFRRFISDAHTEKWTTFSSLIGYEALESFRAGLSSLSGSALTSRLNTADLDKELANRRNRWSVRFESLCRRVETDPNDCDELKDLRAALSRKIEVLAIACDMEPFEVSDADFWDRLDERCQPSDESQQTEQRLKKLDSLIAALTEVPDSVIDSVDILRTLVKSLSVKKEQFDKGILAEFYQRGLRIIDSGATAPDVCPFCKSPYDTDILVGEVRESLDSLDLEAIHTEFAKLRSIWREIGSAADHQIRRLATFELSEVQRHLHDLMSVEEVTQSLRIESFNEQPVSDWINRWLKLQSAVRDARCTAEQERTHLMRQLSQHASVASQEEVRNLRSLWSELPELEQEQRDIDLLQRRVDVTVELIDQIRSAARSFREELRDFSARVVDNINADIERYYVELHPYDKVKPYLDVEVSGSRRRVYLKCDFGGFAQKDAASVLSESHRNSLGLAIMLAFRAYKQRLGSPAEFLVLDDVTQSLDTTHRTSLLDLLENQAYPELSNQQILFLTHDRTLADLIKRPGENRFRRNWLRLDIRNWWLDGIVLEPCSDARTRAQSYLDAGDEIAAAVYARRALEDLYKKVVEKTGVRVRYKSKPWRYSIDDYRQYIQQEIEGLHAVSEGFIDPKQPDFTRLFTAQRILNLTVHDSVFLDAPMTLPDVQTALDMIDDLKEMFSCQHCGRWLSTLRLDKQGNVPRCRVCKQQVR